MKLNHKSVEWAIHSLEQLGDTDLFPLPVEFSVLAKSISESSAKLAGLDISNHRPGPPRRFIVPKDDMSYRAATQLDPLDSVIFTALIHQFGQQIEERRRSPSENSVFSYRFSPSGEGDLYSMGNSWNSFWNTCMAHAKNSNVMLVVDVADFYNQIYHHTIENQLVESKFPNQATKWILRLLETISAKVSRGIPVGPHPAHLLAEASMIPIDNSLAARGLRFCRFVDDIIIFTSDDNEARKALYQIAEILDKQQRLQLQRSKTMLLNRNDFRKYCSSMVEDRPINDFERNLVSLIAKYSKGNPYRTVFLSELTEAELRTINSEVVEKILTDYISMSEPNFVRLRWFIRRLTQTRHPAAIPFLLSNFPRMIPALADICHYFSSVAATPDYDPPGLGENLLDLLGNEVVQSNAYFQLSILSMFNRVCELNHTPSILALYSCSPEDLKREIILTAAACKEADWLRERKEEFSAMAPWVRRAFLYASHQLPMEERRFFLRHVSSGDTLDTIISDWAKKQGQQ